MKSVCERIHTLRALRGAIKEHEDMICAALNADLGKSYFEAQLTELQPVYDEINFHEKYLCCWSKPHKVKTPLKLFPAQSYIYPEAYGNVLIFSPWNFPFNLSIMPLIGALSAGNSITLKPSELSPHTSATLTQIIQAIPELKDVNVVEGGIPVAESLLQKKWDYIFFTGSTRVGKIIMQHAANHLTPITLELGGMNPCIVDSSVNIDRAAQRIMWGKFLNAGQSCLAPNIVYVESSIKYEFIESCKKALDKLYGSNPEKNIEYGRILNEKHMQRLQQLLNSTEIICGGTYDESTRYYAPTLVTDVPSHHPLLHEEIFGPILPIQEYTNLNLLLAQLHKKPKPLALYIFSSEPKKQKMIMNHVSSGGVVLNDIMLQAANPYLPFGGVGLSGFGAYHGKKSFDTFTHYRSVLHNRWWPEITLRYAPWRWGHKIIKKWL